MVLGAVKAGLTIPGLRVGPGSAESDEVRGAIIRMSAVVSECMSENRPARTVRPASHVPLMGAPQASSPPSATEFKWGITSKCRQEAVHCLFIMRANSATIQCLN